MLHTSTHTTVYTYIFIYLRIVVIAIVKESQSCCLNLKNIWFWRTEFWRVCTYPPVSKAVFFCKSWGRINFFAFSSFQRLSLVCCCLTLLVQFQSHINQMSPILLSFDFVSLASPSSIIRFLVSTVDPLRHLKFSSLSTLVMPITLIRLTLSFHIQFLKLQSEHICGGIIMLLS